MSRLKPLLNGFGFVLLGLCFVVSLVRVLTVARQQKSGDLTTIRFAHYQLEGGLRQAFDRLAQEYMWRHPEVRVEQMAVPERVWSNWLITQLIGGTAPDLIETGLGDNDEMKARYFTSVAPWMDQPNPYNANTPLANTPWRKTFFDELSGSDEQGPLGETYAVPNSMFTVRVFYNRALWRQALGPGETLPRTYAEFIAACRRVRDWRGPAGATLLPIAGAQDNAPFLLQRLFGTQTMRLSAALANGGGLTAGSELLAFGFLAGRWSLDTPEVRDGLELVREVGGMLPPGFGQLRREDALFLFCQGRALMMVSGSWDSPSIRTQAPFEVGVFDVPAPDRQDARFGKNVVGPLSEANTTSALGFLMTRQRSSAKEARVLDFLHFLSSQAGNRMFSETSGWLPCVVGVDPPAAVRPFLPREEGFPGGFTMTLGDTPTFNGRFGAETERAVANASYLLFDPPAGVPAYAAAVNGPLRDGIIADLRRSWQDECRDVQAADTTVAALRALQTARPDDPVLARKAGDTEERQSERERRVLVRRMRLERLGVAVEP